MEEPEMTIELVAAGGPVLPAAILVLRRGRAHRERLGLVCHVRDLITLHMVLRDAEPAQRASLLAAHRKWRREPAGKQRG
ncbi:hypothetical protein GCM10010271_08410 [Streptomyces kurssanovii]|nr:hypothetical protein GCM10010271_08410 [Streptomyces kurssanovii]